ncbi:MAG TPA: 6-carboxytetrahydropterin synthase [Longimicrobiales bacterium]
MSVAYLTRSVRFAAAHRYHRPDWSDERNRRVFGACNNPHGHGHTYTLEATVRGRIDPETGFSVDLVMLDRVLDEHVVRVFDHQHINHAVKAFAEGGLIPTSENLLAYLWPRLSAALPDGVTLHRLRLYEDPTLFVDYMGGREEGAAP